MGVKLFKLDYWVALSLEPELLNEEPELSQRYDSIENFATLLPNNLNPDRQSRYYVRIPNKLYAAIKSVATLTTAQPIRSVSKLVMYGSHFGFVRMMKDMNWKQIYNINRAMSIALPSIQELYGESGVNLMFTPEVELSDPKRRVSVFPLIYKGSNMNNIDTMQAIFGQIIPRELIVTQALSDALLYSTTAQKYGLTPIAKKYNADISTKIKETIRKKAELIYLMSKHPDFDKYLSAEGIDQFYKYMRGINHECRT